MAVPWQTDTASCRSGYHDASYDPYVPTFWPARVPNQVLSTENYEIVMNEAAARRAPRGVRHAARTGTRRSGSGNYIDQINTFIADIGQMGVVEMRAGSEGRSGVSGADRRAGRGAETAAAEGARARPGARWPQSDAELRRIEKVHRFPYGLKQLV